MTTPDYDVDRQTPRGGTPPTTPSRPTSPPPAGWDDEDDFVTVRRTGSRLLRVAIVLLVVVGMGWMGYRTARSWFEAQLDPAGEPGEPLQVLVPAGATTSDIGRQLEAMDIIPNSTFFRYYARWKDEGNFQAGEYFIPLNSSASEAIAVLNGGPTPQRYTRFTVREGLWINEILPDVATQVPTVTAADLQAVLDSGRIEPRYRPPGATSWEGLLFPDTYEINVEDGAYEILLRMADEFTRVSGELGYGAAETKLGRSAYEVLIVASLVEAEAKIDSERPLVASVIYNRLREQWPLGIDATCIYGQGNRQVELTKEILNNGEDPYNCREIVGLPPTPINSPGRASLEAAINPAESEFMYYVLTDPSGAHTFAKTAEEFDAAKKICQDLGLC